MYIPGNNKTADCAAINQTPITYSLGYRALWCLQLFFLIYSHCCCALENLKDSLCFTAEEWQDLRGVGECVVSCYPRLLAAVPYSHRCKPLETVFSTVGCVWRPSCSWNYSCLWFWHTALWTMRHLCFRVCHLISSDHSLSGFLSTLFPLPISHDPLDNDQGVYRGRGPRVCTAASPPDSSDLSEHWVWVPLPWHLCPSCPRARCDAWHLGLAFTDYLDALT